MRPHSTTIVSLFQNVAATLYLDLEKILENNTEIQAITLMLGH